MSVQNAPLHPQHALHAGQPPAQAHAHAPRRVAVVGAGVAGLAAAWSLTRTPGVAVTLLERDGRFGGHAHTVDVTLPGADGEPVTHGVDTGFLVFNERTYPRLIELFQALGVPTARSDMSFSVQAPGGLDGRSRRLEWSGSSLDTVFAQRRNLLSPRFIGMLREILRFNRIATALAVAGPASGGESLRQPLADFLRAHRFGQAFVQGYLLPMIGCIWSCPTGQMLHFPVGTLVRFSHNHGLLQIDDRPAWHTVRGGSRRYVEAIVRELADARAASPVTRLERDTDGVTLHTPRGRQRFDAVVLACHAPQALAMLGAGASGAEKAVLAAQRTRPNVAVLHTDVSVMPRTPRAWAAWNYERAGGAADDPDAVCLHYWINRLQPLPFRQPVLVSLNPLRPPREDLVLGRFEVAHPVFDLEAVAAQQRLPQIQGRDRVWFCGAWCGYGFHEDGLKAGFAAAEGVRAWLQASPHGPQLAQRLEVLSARTAEAA